MNSSVPVISFGQALIDFIPTRNGLALKDVAEFKRAPGGAPANVAAAVARLGGICRFIGQVGADPFGDCLKTTLAEAGVDVTAMLQTKEARTALAFVSLREDGERDFMFYPSPSADQLMTVEAIAASWFPSGAIFAFGALSLTHPSAQAATAQALALASTQNNLIVCDPNYRRDLWPSAQAFVSALLPLFAEAHVVKLADEELFILSGSNAFNDALSDASISHPEWQKALAWLELQAPCLKIITRGRHGIVVQTSTTRFELPAFSVTSIDATGAGDAFVGGLLYQLAQHQITPQSLQDFSADINTLKTCLRFAAACGAITTTRRGGIPALPDIAEVEALLTS